MKITFVSRGRFIPSATEAKIRVETFDNTLTDFEERELAIGQEGT